MIGFKKHLFLMLLVCLVAVPSAWGGGGYYDADLEIAKTVDGEDGEFVFQLRHTADLPLISDNLGLSFNSVFYPQKGEYVSSAISHSGLEPMYGNHVCRWFGNVALHLPEQALSRLEWRVQAGYIDQQFTRSFYVFDPSRAVEKSDFGTLLRADAGLTLTIAKALGAPLAFAFIVTNNADKSCWQYLTCVLFFRNWQSVGQGAHRGAVSTPCGARSLWR